MFNNNSSGYEGIKKMLNNPLFAGKTVLKDMLPVKQSTVILDFAKPLLDKIDMSNKSVLEKTVKKAVEVWNSCIVVDRACRDYDEYSKRLFKLSLGEMSRQKLPVRIGKKDYCMLVERKDELYPDNQYFIIEHNIRWNADDSEFSLSVITNDASNIEI
jgi:hypothetical protein